MARLALFSFFCLVLEVRPQNAPRPELSVSPPVVAQDGSVKLDCTAPYERIHQCSFYPQEDKTNLRSSQTCQLSLTGSELIRWTGRGYSSPEQINIICFYTAGESSYAVISPDSRPAPVTIIDAPRLSVSPAGRSHIQLNCTPPYSAGVSRCYFYTEGRERYVKGPSCHISLSVFELIAWANRIYSSPEPIRVTCYYSVRVSHREFLSPHSLPAPVRALELPLLPPPTTTMQWTTPKSTTVASSAVPTLPSETTTASPSTVSTLPRTTRAASLITHSQPGDHTQTETVSRTSSAMSTLPSKTTAASLITHSQPDDHIQTETVSRRTYYIIVLSTTAISVLLAGAMIFCLCIFISKQSTERIYKVQSSSGSQGDMIALNSNPNMEYSVINSVPRPSQPSDPSGHRQGQSKDTQECEYHMYCSITETKMAS